VANLGMKNYMEDCVVELLPSVMEQMDMCQCHRCRLDTMAHALNTLPPKYVVTLKGRMYSKVAVLQSQFNVDIVTALTVAAEVVQKNPRHEEN